MDLNPIWRQYWRVASGNRQSPRVSIYWLVPVFTFSVIAGFCLTITLETANLANWGQWLRDFARSPGAAAFAALVAAAIAFTGISKQVMVSREALAHQRNATRADAWWAMFEWASDRAIPPNKDAQPLPPSVTIRTLQRLSEDASTDVQKAACAGVIDVLTANISDAAMKQGPEDPITPQGERENPALSALNSYVKSNRGTPAASAIAEGLVYENNVLKELISLSWQDPRIKIIRIDSFAVDNGFDAIADVDGQQVAVVIKASKNGGRRHLQELRNNSVHLGQTVANIPMLLISPSPPTNELSESGIFATQWRGPEDTATLGADLRRASKLVRPPG